MVGLAAVCGRLVESTSLRAGRPAGQGQGVKDVVVEEERPTPWNPVAVGDVNFLPFFVPQEPQRCAARLVDCAGGMEPREAEIFLRRPRALLARCARWEAWLGSMDAHGGASGRPKMLVPQEPWDALCRACFGGLVGGTRNLDGGGTWSPGLAREVDLRPLWSGLADMGGQ